MVFSSNAFYELKYFVLEKICADLQLPKNIQLWTRNSFKQVSRYISKAIENSTLISEKRKRDYGTCISASTLERLLKYGYELPNPIDKRRLNTLNKICVYLGYIDWNAYCQSVSLSGNNNEQFKQIIKEGLQAEFEVYKNMPQNTLSKLTPYFTHDGPAYKQIRQLVVRINRKQWHLKNKNNPSYFKILNIDLLRIDKAEVQLITHECWYLSWQNEHVNTASNYYKDNSHQLYILKKEDQIWKIYLNHYPYKTS